MADNKQYEIIRDFPPDDRYSVRNIVKRYRKTLAENLQCLIDDGEVTENSTVKEVIAILKG